MPQWLKMKCIERPYYDPRTGEVLSSIKGRRNRPGIDPFVGGGWVYPEEWDSLECLDKRQEGDTILLLVDEPQEVLDSVEGRAGKKSYPASPKEVWEYDVSDHRPMVLSDDDALYVFKKECGFPEGTTLDADKRPVIPEETTVEANK